jgi:hypothetical protein
MLPLLAAGQLMAQSFHRGQPISLAAETRTIESANKGAAVGDTIYGKLNFSSAQLSADSLASYRVDSSPYDSGYIFGPNVYGDKGFAERFDFNGTDSSVKVIGTYAIFDGRYNTSTTKTINVRVWNQSAKVPFTGRPKLFLDAYPGTVLTTQVVSIKNLGINQTSTNDSLKYIAFTAPTLNLKDSFYVGYDMNYAFNTLAGDTITVKSTRNGYRYVPIYFLQGTDTVLNVKNAAQYNDGTWHDIATDDFQVDVHLCFFPVLVVRGLGIDGITKNSLVFHGTFPNPSNTTTNVKFELKRGADVTIQIADMSGRIITTQQHKALAVGMHDLPVNVSALAAGNYICLIRTSDNDGLGVQMTVAH